MLGRSFCLLGICASLIGCSGPEPKAGPVAVESGVESGVETPDVAAMVQQRAELDRTVWADEVAAQLHEEPFVALWDQLRAAEVKHRILAEFPFQQLDVPAVLSEPRELAHGVRVFAAGEDSRQLDPPGFRDWLDEWAQAGFRIVESEWHHSAFTPDPSGARSTVAMTLHIRRDSPLEAYVVKGDLEVQWAVADDRDGPPRARRIDASRLSIQQRADAPLFVEAASIKVPRGERISMLIAGDLNGDGLSEILLPCQDKLYWNRGDFQFEEAPLLLHRPASPVRTAVLGDFTGDGRADLLCAMDSVIALYPGAKDGRFLLPPQEVLVDRQRLTEPTTLASGDVDGDGDLDAFLGQYKLPYAAGQMPTPYFDANDGFPCYLLLNENGELRDATISAGLQSKRNRRTYSSSLVDIDGDGDLDLLTANDFSGLDVHRNDGRGVFTDVTSEAVDRRHAFGMALTFGDYDNDAALDFMMIGMSSTTARRLDHMQLGRREFPEHQEKRREMGYGNRLYLSGEGGHRQAPFNDQVARTGWSWGTTTLDFDNDGDRDIYVVNGHQSGATAKDYCTRYWCHDIYIDSSGGESERLSGLFDSLRQEQSKLSWNGYEHNVLFMNIDGQGFMNVGFLAGVAFEFDSRSALSDDLDGDGRMDLAVIGKAPRDEVASLHLLRNTAPVDENNWVGLRLPADGVGASVTVVTPERSLVAAVVSGDSLLAQHAPVVHFGLGQESRIDRVEVRWPDGRRAVLTQPEINRYHLVSRPEN